MKKLDLDIMISDLIDAMPSIKDKYQKENAEWLESEEFLDDEDKEILASIDREYNLPTREGIPITIFIEDLYIPELIKILNNKSPDYNIISNSMKVFEKYARSEEFYYRNTVAVSLCEQLLVRYESDLRKLFPFLGEATKNLVKMQLDEFRLLDEETLNLFR